MILFRLWRRIFARKRHTALIYNPECMAHDMGPENPETPERLTAIMQAFAQSKLSEYVGQTSSAKATEQQIARVHPPSYLNYLESITPNTGIVTINADMAIGQHSLNAAQFAAGAVVKAVDMVMSAEVFNAFCAIRPPGHHAHSKKSVGFCFLNNVAIGAMHALNEHRLKRVAIVDFDAHHGDGTEEIVQNDSRIMFLSVFQHPFFPFNDEESLKEHHTNPNIILSPLAANSGSFELRKTIARQWLPRLKAFKPELIIISAGFDGHKDDEMSHLNFVEADYKWMTEKLMRIADLYGKGRMVSVLEGGYNVSSLSRSVIAHLEALTSS
ncbi:histone deacetylase family protein [Neisseria sp. Ec49-e6-T10]|uniref:histone deacetylase family protein n=1 Tax=Neisseria sp. Ec49-e6-T10 TaxID=3140744 RepID=UPI003EB8BB77